MENKKNLGAILKRLWPVLILELSLVYVFFVVPSMQKDYEEKYEAKEKEKKALQIANAVNSMEFVAYKKVGDSEIRQSRVIIIEPDNNGRGYAFFEDLTTGEEVESVMREYNILETNERVLNFAECYKCVPYIENKEVDGKLVEVGKISHGGSVLKAEIEFDYNLNNFDFDGDGRKYIGNAIGLKEYNKYKKKATKTQAKYQELKAEYEKELNS